ncbi:GTPase Era [Membranicola marinus]|uniref:GTPase Era n=1 Tax=Membranihabitans marinus TaxID=1227546 RepID=A0A953I0E8_9BACT|nr:GTPase Era [Membranihabitans marinus]
MNSLKLNNIAHKSGFVNIIGLPNVGKSTLMNQLLGEKLSIVTHKPQTTRHRILGILSAPEYQIVLSDVPGYVEDMSYEMHRKMNTYIEESFKDGDILLVMINPGDQTELAPEVLKLIDKSKAYKILVVNKIDLHDSDDVKNTAAQWNEKLAFDETRLMAAETGEGVGELLDTLVAHLPEGPAYYPKDQISNKNVRFFISEMIREQIFLQFRQEIPYSAQVDIEGYTDKEDIIHIDAIIYVNRKSQKYIIIGKNGSAIKQLGIASRKNIEEFIGKQVFLKLHVKVREKWRNNEDLLRKFGY